MRSGGGGGAVPKVSTAGLAEVLFKIVFKAQKLNIILAILAKN